MNISNIKIIQLPEILNLNQLNKLNDSYVLKFEYEQPNIKIIFESVAGKINRYTFSFMDVKINEDFNFILKIPNKILYNNKLCDFVLGINKYLFPYRYIRSNKIEDRKYIKRFKGFLYKDKLFYNKDNKWSLKYNTWSIKKYGN